MVFAEVRQQARMDRIASWQLTVHSPVGRLPIGSKRPGAPEMTEGVLRLSRPGIPGPSPGDLPHEPRGIAGI